MFSIEQYMISLNNDLNKQSEQVITALQDVFTRPFAPDVELLDFSTFIDPTRFEFTVMMFSMAYNANEVFTENPSFFAGSLEIIQNTPYYALDEALHDAFFEFYEEHAETLEPLEQQAFTAWFAMCWEQAGGGAHALPAYFGFHDADSSYLLQDARYVEDTKKWC